MTNLCLNEKFTKKWRYLLFVGLAVLFVGLLIAANFLDLFFNKGPIFNLVVQFLFFVISLELVCLSEEQFGLHVKKFNVVYYVLGIVPILFACLVWYGPLNLKSDYWQLFLAFLSVILTGLWQEMFFRGVGYALLKPGRKKNLGAFFVITLVFGLSFLPNLAFYPGNVGFVLFGCFVALILGMFLLVVFLRAQTITLPIVINIVFNLPSVYFVQCSTKPMILGELMYYVLMSTMCVILLVISVFLMVYECNGERNDAEVENGQMVDPIELAGGYVNHGASAAHGAAARPVAENVAVNPVVNNTAAKEVVVEPVEIVVDPVEIDTDVVVDPIELPIDDQHNNN